MLAMNSSEMNLFCSIERFRRSALRNKATSVDAKVKKGKGVKEVKEVKEVKAADAEQEEDKEDEEDEEDEEGEEGEEEGEEEEEEEESVPCSQVLCFFDLCILHFRDGFCIVCRLMPFATPGHRRGRRSCSSSGVAPVKL